MHVIGDTYAHRSIVPAYVFNNCDTYGLLTNSLNHDSRFGTKHFKSGSCSVSVDTLKEYAEDTKKYADKICKHWSCFKNLGKNSKSNLEFRDIKYFTTTEKAGLDYEDEMDFCAERYYNTKISCQKFMEDSMASKTYSYKIFWPTLTIKLKGYKTLSKRAGEKIDTALAWSKVSFD